MTEADKSTIEGVQFKLGHIAGSCYQVLELLDPASDEFHKITVLVKGVHDSALHISKALEKMRKADG